jgi:hypothetical protein
MEKYRFATLAGYNSSFKSCLKISTYKSNIAALQKIKHLTLQQTEEIESNYHIKNTNHIYFVAYIKYKPHF